MADSNGVLPERADFAKMEEKVLDMWKSIDAFKTSLKVSCGVAVARLCAPMSGLLCSAVASYKQRCLC